MREGVGHVDGTALTYAAMKRFIIALAMTLCTAPIASQSKSDVIYWPASTLSGYSATLKGRQGEKKTLSASEILSDLGNHKFEILRRDGSGAGELHQNWTDIFIVQSGEGTILHGGSLEDAKDTASRSRITS